MLILQPKDELRTIAEDTVLDDFTLTRTVRKYIKNTDTEIITNNLTDGEKNNILEKIKEVDNIIIGTMSANKNDDITKFINELSQLKNLNIVSMKSPYIGQWLNNINSWINTYEPNKLPIDIAVRALMGDIKPSGISPVTLNL